MSDSTSTAAPSRRWTNRSVLELAKGADPVEVIKERARGMVLDALDRGWAGPPFDPIALALLLGFEITANSEVPDGRVVPLKSGKARIEFNPNRPRGRMRYSIAHEIAHTLFPDAPEQIRHRAHHGELQGDEWQLEALCNIAAAEFLMPFGSLPPVDADTLSIHGILELQRRFDVSTEALVIRLVETTDVAVAGFCASPREVKRHSHYQLDYMITSRSWGERLPRHTKLPADSVVHQCIAIGYSARGIETWWPKFGPTQVDAIGIPPYPGGNRPRVVGVLKPTHEHATASPCISYVHGSALEPRGNGARLLIHVVNDKTPNWGGAGFASALRTARPSVQQDFQMWAEGGPSAMKLGQVHVSRVDDEVSVASIVAQHGYGDSATPRIRYSALRSGLVATAQLAREAGASVHMPRIGTGHAGGAWSIIRDLIAETLCEAGVPVTVYDLPGTVPRPESQTTLPLVSSAPT